MEDMCEYNRFKVIEKARKALLNDTNIASSKKEMEALDSFLFRCWQMGWLRQYEDKPKYQKGERIFWKHGHLVYSMVVEEFFLDRLYPEFMYVAMKPKCKYAMYWVREPRIIEKPTLRDMLLAKLSFGIECVLGLLKYKRK